MSGRIELFLRETDSTKYVGFLYVIRKWTTKTVSSQKYCKVTAYI
jgi:hypothetical protein